MVYPREFFAFQLTFAKRVAKRFGLDFVKVIQQYTPMGKGITDDAWKTYCEGLQSADPIQWAYDWHLTHDGPDPQPDDTDFYGHALVGCFYYVVRNDEAGEATIIRPHFVKNDRPGCRPLSSARLAVRQDEMRRMFRHIAEHVPTARTVLGNSWLYNLEAYRRIFPPTYTTLLPATEYEELQYLALWGQCFDRDWQPKAQVTDELLRRVDRLAALADLQSSFPYAVRRPQCEISKFFDFYG